MLKIDLLKKVGTSCKMRTDPKIPELKTKIRESILKNEDVVMSIKGVMSVTPSFLDQLFGELVMEFGPETVFKICKFEPELYYSFHEQLERSARLRGWEKQSA